MEEHVVTIHKQIDTTTNKLVSTHYGSILSIATQLLISNGPEKLLNLLFITIVHKFLNLNVYGEKLNNT